MMAAVKTQNQTLFLGRTPSAWNRRIAENRAVTGIFDASVTGTVGIQDNVLIDTARVSGLDVMYSLNLLTMGVASQWQNASRESATVENRTLEPCRNRFKKKRLDR